MIAQVNLSEEGQIRYMTPEEFFILFTKELNGIPVFLHPEARDWAKFGRPYSRYQIGDRMFMRVPEKNDDKVRAALPKE
jgi:hypothetical protein